MYIFIYRERATANIYIYIYIYAMRTAHAYKDRMHLDVCLLGRTAYLCIQKSIQREREMERERERERALVARICHSLHGANVVALDQNSSRF